MSGIADQIIGVIEQFTQAADRKQKDFLTVKDSSVVLDMWQADWGSLGCAAEKADRLATIFQDAGFKFALTNQPTGPAKNSGGSHLFWDNLPLLSVEIPKHDPGGRKAVELMTVAKMAKRYNTPAGKFSAHS